ncbi:hypothetical protein G210_5122, partial [Candida maltosa Xu316]
MYFAASGIYYDDVFIQSYETTNNGLMVFYLGKRSSSHVLLQSPGDTVNNGQMCFRKHNYHQTSNIAGSGCFTALEGGSIYFYDPDRIFGANLSFYLADAASFMVVGNIKTGYTFKVYGFGNGNKIGFNTHIPIYNDPIYSYDEKTGVLTLTNRD